MMKHTRKAVEVSAHDIVGEKNFIARSDFKNSRIQFERNKKGHVAFIGGSITEMNGYRPIMMEYLKDRFPQTRHSRAPY